MNYDNYMEYLKAMTDTYSKKVKNHILNMLIGREIAVKNPTVYLPNAIDISRFSLSHQHQLDGCLDTKDIRVTKVIEEWEFKKDYSYSVLYKTNNLNKDELIEKTETLNLKFFSIESSEFDDLQSCITKPILTVEDHIIIFKFLLKKETFHPEIRNDIKLKYPITAVLFLDYNILEIRYDSISGLFVENSKQFYQKNIKSVRNWFEDNMNIDIENYIIDKSINNLKDINGIVLDGKDMRFSNGGRACLEIGTNESYTLPLLGELSNIIENNKKEFDKTPLVKELLEKFIMEKENEADYNWICLCWQGKIKSNNIKVRFQFNYIENDVCLLYHYSGPIGMERMNNVTRCIIENQKVDKK